MTTRAGFVALIGEPNAGKSTLLNLIGGFAEPTEGDVLIGADGRLLRQRIGPFVAGELDAFAADATR